MNERILELTKAAEQYANEQTKKATELDQLLDWNNIYDTKLIELVVQQCAEVCSKIGYANISDGDKAFGYGANFCAYRIKQHLGVEE